MTFLERNFINQYGMASQGAYKVAQQNEAEIKNGAFGTIGRLENFLQADNIVNSALLKSTVATISNAVGIADTATFKYKASNNRIIFKKVNPCIYDGDISVTVDFPNKRIIVDEKDYPLRVNNESVNWDEINKIIGR